jgi:hypothetical protein
VLSEILNDLDSETIIVSCTTDGFLTNQNLDGYEHKGEFAKIYLIARKNLGAKPVLLEKKHSDSKGVISWSTRGQVGLEGNIKATTGLRVSKDKALKVVTEAFLSKDRIFNYQTMSLRGANTIFKNGGMVTPEYGENTFMPIFDNRREIVGEEKMDNFEPLKSFLTTIPFNRVEECSLARQLGKLTVRKYSELSPLESNNPRSDTYLNLGVRMFIRLCIHEPSILGIDRELYRMDIVEILNSLDVVKTPNYVSVQKRFKFIEKSVPKVPSTISFVEKVKYLYPQFNEDLFFKN